VWTIIPAGEYIASAAASAILWLVLMNSTLKSPRVTDCPYLTTFLLTDFNILCSLSFDSISPIVSLVAYIGTLTSFKTYGIAPI